MSSLNLNKSNTLSTMKQKILDTPLSKSFWQSDIWASILTKTRQAEVIYTLYDNEKILIERRKIWWKYHGLYILGTGISHFEKAFFEEIQKNIVTDADLFLQIEPLRNAERWTLNVERLNAPFRRFLEPVTALLDLTMDEVTLLASFTEKWRYNIRLAEKRWVTTRWVPWNSTLNIEKTYIELFYNLLDETTKRDGFSHNSLSYYQQFVETLEENNAGWLLVAEKDGILHAAGIFVFTEQSATYYYGASSSDPSLRRDMATYLLQWEAIREGKKRGCTSYDFLGISEDGKWKLAGVTEFKMRFHPEKVYLPKEIIVVYKPITLIMLQLISRLKKVLRCW